MAKRIFPIRIKLFLYFFLIISFPFSISGLISYQVYMDSSEKSLHTYTIGTMNQIRQDLDSYFRQLDSILTLPIYEPSIYDILRNHDTPLKRESFLNMNENNKMISLLSASTLISSNIESISVFTNDGAVFSDNSVTVKNSWDEREIAWMNRLAANEGGLTFLPAHPVNYYRGMDNKPVISMGRLIREPNSHRTLGFLKLDISPDSIKQILLLSPLGSQSQFRIMSNGNEQLYPLDALNELPPNDFIQHSVALSAYPISLVGMISKIELKDGANTIVSFILIALLLSLAVTYFLAWLLSKSFTYPILSMLKAMQKVQLGLFQERAHVTGNDEFGLLSRGFNSMVEKIDTLVKEVYEVRLLEKDAQLAALQSQINPHFLYNTLEMLNMLVIRNEGQQASPVIVHLGKLMRYTISNEITMVRLIEEIQFVESYLNIQEMRARGKLVYRISIALHKHG